MLANSHLLLVIISITLSIFEIFWSHDFIGLVSLYRCPAKLLSENLGHGVGRLCYDHCSILHCQPGCLLGAGPAWGAHHRHQWPEGKICFTLWFFITFFRLYLTEPDYCSIVCQGIKITNWINDSFFHSSSVTPWSWSGKLGMRQEYILVLILVHQTYIQTLILTYGQFSVFYLVYVFGRWKKKKTWLKPTQGQDWTKNCGAAGW